jgi:molybdopterin converting factor small subunit
MKLRVLISGRGYDAAEGIPIEWEVAEGTTLSELVRAVNQRLPPRHPLPPACLVAVSGVHLGTVGRLAPRELQEADEIVFVAPVAGG